MKVRSGFVSNSSSSSFCVIYRPAELSEIDDEDIHVIGKYLWEARDYFKPDETTKKAIKKYWDLFGYEDDELTLVHEILAIGEWDETIEGDIEILAGTRVNVFKVDQSSTADFREFRENYDLDRIVAGSQEDKIAKMIDEELGL